MDKEFELECDNCGSHFTIISHDGEEPTVCPYCGSDLDTKRNDEEYEDD